MSDIKEDVKSSVKDFTQVSVSKVVKESTKKLIKNLPERQKRLLEAKIRDMLDDQIEQYFADDLYFKDALENTIKSVSASPPKKVPGFWKKRIESVSKCTYENLATTLSSQVVISIILVVVIVALVGILVLKPPVANFTNTSVPNASLTIQFNDTSSYHPTSWKWDFGDNNTSTEQNLTHKYSKAGNYTVTLTASNVAGSNTTTKENILITLKNITLPPVANFSSNVTSGKAPLSVKFTDKSTGEPTEWNWNFGDGTSSTQQNPEHQYLQEGKYKVTLTASNTAGSNTTTKENYIKVVRKPVANFTSNVTTGRVPLSVQFTDFSQNATELNWNFGDETNSSDQRPVHVYFSVGIYNVNLTATNENGNDSKFATIEALKKSDSDSDLKILPVANFSSNVSEGYAPLPVQFTDLSQNAIEWNWDFGDNNTSSEQSPAHTYSTAGNYTIFLTAINGKDTNSTHSTITVLNQSLPVANFSSNVSEGYAPLPVQFTDLSQNAIEWNWDFGDNNTSSEQNPKHVYSSARNYDVNLTVSNENGTDSKTATINVSVVLPVANFTSNVSEGYAPLPVQFIDHSQNATGWNWDFGDGNNSTQQNPMNTFSAARKYDVNLTVSNENGTDSKIATINVSEPVVLPIANFTNNVSEGYAPLPVQFTDLSQNATEWNWDFGDNNTSSEQNPTHVYSSAGNYTVNLTANNENGTDSKTATINVSVVLPVANFTSNVTRGDAPLPVQFTDLSQNATKWNWDFGDETNSSKQSPAHIYFAAGNYTVNLTVSNENGTNSTSATITVIRCAYVSNRGSNTVSVIDTTNNTVISTVHVGKAPWGVAVSPDGKNVYVGNNNSNNVSVIDTVTGKVTDSVNVGNNPVGVAVSPDGTKVYVANSYSNTVSVIDTSNNTVTNTVNVGIRPGGVAVSPDGTKVYVTNWISGNVSIIDAATDTVNGTVNVEKQPEEIAVSPSGATVYVVNGENGTVSIIDTATDTVTATVRVGNNPYGVAVSPDGKNVYVTNRKDNSVSVINATTNTVVATVNVGSWPVGISVNPKGTSVYVVNYKGGTVSVIDTSINKVTSIVKVESKPMVIR